MKNLITPAHVDVLRPLGVDLGSGRNPHGLVCAANEARFTFTHYSEPLTAYTVGWRDPEDIDGIMRRLFPEVEVGRRFEFKKATNADEFLSEADDIRAIGDDFKVIKFKGESVNEKTHNKGLTVRVDHDEVAGDGWREMWTAYLLRRLARNDLRRGITLVDAAATNVAKVWNAASNPDGDLRGMLKLGADASGIRPNVVAMGEAAADMRLDVYEAADTPYAGRAASMTMQDLSRKLMVDLVEVLKARYQSAAAVKTALLGLGVYAYYAAQGITKDDPSNVKRFVTPTASGRYRVYVEEHMKYTEISVEHYSNIVVTSTLGIRKITPAAA